MRVLHVWNTAGVGGVIAKYMDHFFETESKVLTRALSDRLNFTNDKVVLIKEGIISSQFPKLSYVNSYLHILFNDFNPHIFHVHSHDQLIPWLKRIYPTKPLILHYHGTDIRDKWLEKRKYWIKAEKTIVATEDLLKGAPKNVEFQPNPIDIDKIPQILRKRPAAFFTSVERGKADDLAKNLAKKHGVPLHIHSRDENPLPHRKYLETIANHEYFIDIRRRHDQPGIFKVFSLGALEALAAGCKVIDWNGEIREGLPPEHHPKNVARAIHDTYLEILACS